MTSGSEADPVEPVEVQNHHHIHSQQLLITVLLHLDALPKQQIIDKQVFVLMKSLTNMKDKRPKANCWPVAVGSDH